MPEVRPRSVLRLGSRSLISNSQCSQRAAASLRAGVSFVSCWRLLVWRRDALGCASLLPPVLYSLAAYRPPSLLRSEPPCAKSAVPAYRPSRLLFAAAAVILANRWARCARAFFYALPPRLRFSFLAAFVSPFLGFAFIAPPALPRKAKPCGRLRRP